MPSSRAQHLVFVPVAGLPPLAWCAELSRGKPEILVRHGLLVETAENAFFEGAWDGPFSEFGFATACTTMGSGGICEDRQTRIVGPSHTCESLVSLRKGDRLWVSNSLAFGLASAGETPDLRYPYYHRDLLELQRRGITGAKPTRLPTASGRTVLLHAATDLLVDGELNVSMQPRPALPEPRDFAAYRAQLAEGVAGLLRNASDPVRRHELRCAVTISAGYDSPAIAVLAAEAGLRNAITFETAPGCADSGRAIAEKLGMNLHALDPGAWRKSPEPPDAEFLATSSGWAMLPIAGLAPEWRSAAIFLGTMGDDLWRHDRQDVLDTLARPRELQPCYAGLREFRLRAGIVFLHAPTIGATHASAIFAMGQSTEMRPWRIVGKYNRPIPRRIVETAGIPRAAFGQAIHMTIDTQTEEILQRLKRSSFASFVREAAPLLPRGLRWRLLLDWHLGPAFARLRLATARKTHGAGRRLRLRLLEHAGKKAVIRIIRRRWHEPMSIRYTFHWATAELLRRYRDAGPGVTVQPD